MLIITRRPDWLVTRYPYKDLDLTCAHCHTDQLRRFSCICYIKVQRVPESKFSFRGIRTVLVGYTETAYQLLHLELGKFYESRNIKFNKKLVYGDRFGPNSIRHWPEEEQRLSQKEEGRWFSELIDMLQGEFLGEETAELPTRRKQGRSRKEPTNTDNNDSPPAKQRSKPNGQVPNETMPIKRGRGRPRKNISSTKYSSWILVRCNFGSKVNDTSNKDYLAVPHHAWKQRTKLSKQSTSLSAVLFASRDLWRSCYLQTSHVLFRIQSLD